MPPKKGGQKGGVQRANKGGALKSTANQPKGRKGGASKTETPRETILILDSDDETRSTTTAGGRRRLPRNRTLTDDEEKWVLTQMEAFLAVQEGSGHTLVGEPKQGGRRSSTKAFQQTLKDEFGKKFPYRNPELSQAGTKEELKDLTMEATEWAGIGKVRPVSTSRFRC